MNGTKTKRREINIKEFRNEPEHPYKWFIIHYHEMNSVIWLKKIFQNKVDVERYLDNPLTSDFKIEVCELINNE